MTRPLDAMYDPAARAARTAARRLAPRFGASLIADVDASLGGAGRARPSRFADPLEIAALVVTAAQLAWTVVSDLRARGSRANARSVADAVRKELDEGSGLDSDTRNAIVETVAEIVIDEPAAPEDGPENDDDSAE